MALTLSSMVQYLPESPQLVKDATASLQRLMSTLSANRPITAKLLKLFGITTLMFAATQIVRRAYYSLLFKSRRYPPGPIGLPFFGCFFARWPLHNLAFPSKWPCKMAAQYPRLCMFPYGPWSYGVLINDKALIAALSKEAQFATRPPFWARMATNEIPAAFSNINGPEMLRRRKIFMSTITAMTDSRFFADYVQQNILHKIMFPAIDRAIADNDAKWDSVWDSCFSLTFNTIFGASFGQRTLDLHDAKYLEFKTHTETVFKGIQVFFMLGVLAPGFMERAAKGKTKGDDDAQPHQVRIRTILTSWLNERSEREIISGEDSYVDRMMASDLDTATAVSEIMVAFQAGAHTTCASLVSQIYTLAKYPKVQEQIYAQLKDLYGDEETIAMADASDYRKLKKGASFLRAFVEETWRLPISGMGNPRELLEDFEVPGTNYVLPKGALIEFNGPALVRDTKTWRTPNEFDIMNFIGDDGQTFRNPMGSGLDPVFGFGLRNCPAKNLARKENLYTVAYLVYNFKFAGPKGQGDTEFKVPFFSVKPEFPLTVKRR